MFRLFPPQLRSGCAAVLLTAGSAWSVSPVSAQDFFAPPIRASETPDELYARADSLFDAWDVEASHELLTTRLDRLPYDYEARWRAARAALAIGILADDPGAGVEWIERAGAHGDAAVVLDSTGVDGLYWAAVSRGRLALQYGPRTSTELAQQMWDLTERLLARDPDHPGGHNILGKLNHEVESLSSVERFFGRLVLRKPFLSETSWEAALRHHRRAVAGDSTVILFRKDLGETLHRSGDSDAARAVLEEALELPPVWPVDEYFKTEIRRYLAEMGG